MSWLSLCLNVVHDLCMILADIHSSVTGSQLYVAGVTVSECTVVGRSAGVQLCDSAAVSHVLLMASAVCLSATADPVYLVSFTATRCCAEFMSTAAAFSIPNRTSLVIDL